MALQILREASNKICHCTPFFSIMANECTDVANTEQFTTTLRWVAEGLEVHESFIGLYEVGSIDSNSLVSAIKDILLHLGLQFSACRGQCYDGASNMSGQRNGVATQILAKEKRAVFVHCYAYALNLAVGDTLGQ